MLQVLATLLLFAVNISIAYISWKRYQNELRLYAIEERKLAIEEEKINQKSLEKAS